MLFKHLAISLFASSGIGAGTLGIGYFSTKKTIFDLCKERVLESDINEDLSEEWKEIYKKLENKKVSSPIDDEINKSEDLKIVNSYLGLKDWCKDKYENIYYSIFSKENNLTKNLVEKYCVLEIKEKLKGKIFENDKDSAIDTKFLDLKSHSDSEINGFLDDELEKVKLQEEKNGLFKWCESRYSEGYRGNNNKWKLVYKYCSK